MATATPSGLSEEAHSPVPESGCPWGAGQGHGRARCLCPWDEESDTWLGWHLHVPLHWHLCQEPPVGLGRVIPARGWGAHGRSWSHPPPPRPWLRPAREPAPLQLGAPLLLLDPELWVLTHHRAAKC